MSKIITVGISPAWDIKCTCDNIRWGEHINIASKTITPAGKALNISTALASMQIKNIATGLWGNADYKQMKTSLKPLSDFLKVKITPVPGQTRQNFWIFNRSNSQDIHLRDKNNFVTPANLTELSNNLEKIVRNDDYLVFAGTMPAAAVRMIKKFTNQNLIIDTSSSALKQVLKLKRLFLIKPNIDELRELLNVNIKNTPRDIIKHASKLTAKVENILISRGSSGAILLTQTGAWTASAQKSKFKLAGTVGCGDYLLAGFIAGLRTNNDISQALNTAIISASLRAFGLDGGLFKASAKKIKVKIEKLNL